MEDDMILRFKYDDYELFNRYLSAVDREDFYTSTLLYNRLRQNKDRPELLLWQVSVWLKISDPKYEIDNLLKLLTYENFYGYNPFAVISQLSSYIFVITQNNRFEYYKNFIKQRWSKKSKKDIFNFEDLKPNGKIHLESSSGRYYYDQSILNLEYGELQKARENLLKIGKDDELYTKSQNLLALTYLSEQDMSSASEIWENLVESKRADAESYYNYYRVCELDNNKKNQILKEIDDLYNKEKDEELLILKADLYLDEKKYDKALKELLKVKSVLKWSSSYLKKLGECYHNLRNFEKELDVIKTLATIHSKDCANRYAVKLLEMGKEFDYFKLMYMPLSKTTKKDLIGEAKQFLIDDMSFANVSIEDVEYFLNIVINYGNLKTIKEFVFKLYRSKYKSLLLDFLFYIETPHTNRQLLFQTILTLEEKHPLYLLVNENLKCIKPQYPKVLYSQKSSSKVDFLKSCYCQAFSMTCFIEKDEKLFCKMSNSFFEIMEGFKDDELNLLKSSDNLVYLLMYLFCRENISQYENSFNSISGENRILLNELANKYYDKVWALDNPSK